MNKHYSWLIDPGTGDYQISKGSPIRDESLQFPAYVRLKTVRKSWLYAPNTSFGSDISLIVKQTRNSPQALESAAAKALQPIIDDGRALSIAVDQTGNARFMEEIEVKIVDNNNQTQAVVMNPIGV